MRPRIHARACLPLLVAALVLAGCGRDLIVQDFGPEALYEEGQAAMARNNYPVAVAYFQQLEARYPFSNLARQAQLDIIYAYYRSRQRESAIDAAEQFERENPTNARVDYALYMKGLVYFDPAPGLLERIFKADMTMRPPKDSVLAFATFQELIRRYPDSRYVPDARQRMVFLRNRLAAYENHVANYYMEREAYVAAASRAKYALETYPGAPALEESLAILVDAYQRMGMTDLAADAERVYGLNFGAAAALQ
jgi:outer membrane protein assembly factor BamD